TPSVNLSAGMTPGTFWPYAVTLTDAAGCSAASGLVIQTLGGISQTQIVLVLPAGVCGGSDGAIVLRPLNGQPPYNFAWSGPTPGVLTNAPAGETVLSGLKPGVYRVSVTDQSANGCSMVLPQIVVNAPGFSVQIDTLQHPRCAGGADGRIALAVQGANPQITWSNNQNGPIASQLAAGTYTATVTVGGCTKTLDNLTLVDPPPLLPVVNAIVNERCFGHQDGRIDVAVSGGTPPYAYSWSDDFQGQDPETLEPGIYSLTVVDANGCSAVLANIEVEGPMAPLAVVVTTIDSIRCFGDQIGQLWAQTNGGTSPYSFEWSDGSTFERLYGLSAAAYAVSVSDGNGCTASASTILGQPNVLELADLEVQQPTCAGAANGIIMTTVNGGTTPYYYEWNTGAQTEVLNNLDAGLYLLTVSDAKGCMDVSIPAILEAPQVLDLALDSVSDVRCAGALQGYIGVSVSGGTAPLSYVWDGQPGGPVLANAASGQHTLVVKDAMQCLLRDTFELQGPTTALSLILESIQNTFCAGEPNGSILIQTIGGTPPYAWYWNDQTNTEDLSAASAGNYAVTVTDVLACTASLGPMMIKDPPAMNVQVNAADIPCFGPQTGSVVLSVSGGVAPYTYMWSTGHTTPGIFGLAAGGYAVTVSDATGCAVVLPDVLIRRKIERVRAQVVSVSPVSCNEASDGKIVVLAENARAPYQFAWSAPIGLHPNLTSPIDSAVNLSGGAYSVLVTDSDGCSFRSDTIWIEEAPLIKIGFQGQLQIACKGDSTGRLEALVSGGLPPYAYAWSTSGGTKQITHLPAGPYAVTVTDEQGCTAVAGPVFIQEPAQALKIVSAQVTNDDCAIGLGRIALGVSGGKQPYFYDWSDGQIGSIIDSLYSGTYVTTVTDALGCAVVSSAYTVSGAAQPVALQVLLISDPACHGDSTGSIAIQASGGYGGYTFFWSVGGNGGGIGQLPAGLYTVTLTDQQGCSATETYMIKQPPAFAFSSTADSLSAGWQVSLTLVGGTPPYAIVWNAAAGNQTGPVATGLAGGVYEATATDAQGCVYAVTGIVAGTVSSEVPEVLEPVFWPNPTDGWLQVCWPGERVSKRILLYGPDGRPCVDGLVQEECQLIDLRRLPSGVYWLMGLENGVRVFFERIVIM
ncbi:MAG: SprB repeat-containing protein, partial [Saprospiraceae bacterium]